MAASSSVVVATDEIKVLIVGAGCFGLSTALHLLRDSPKSVANRRYNVTVIDASPTLPAPDAASSDLNKVVRTCYDDEFYTKLAKEAIEMWKAGDLCGKETYHESGVLSLGLQDQSQDLYASVGLQNDLKLGARITILSPPSAIKEIIPNSVVFGPEIQKGKAYFNADGGWASATKAIKETMKNIRQLGGTILANKKLVNLEVEVRDGRRVMGAILENGEILRADYLILAMGAWTPSVLAKIPEMAINDKLRATGQIIATIQLDSEMAAKYSKAPTILNWSTGFYILPPNEDGIVKFAIHNEGYLHIEDLDGVAVSVPRTIRSRPNDGTSVPSEMLSPLYGYLQSIYPEFGGLPLLTTRLCWYTDTPDENWIIDEHPDVSGLFLATGGSGHAFKFLPVIGRLVRERLEGNLDPSVAAKFSLNRPTLSHHGSRQGHAKPLNENEISGPKQFNESLGLNVKNTVL